MGLFSWMSRKSRSQPKVQASGGVEFSSLDDPRFYEFMRGGFGATSPQHAMRNTSVLRCVSLISNSIGMLPLHLRDRETKEYAKDVPLYNVLRRKPNGWQTAYEFRTYMQQAALGAVGSGRSGDAFARIVRRSSGEIVGLIPIHPDRVTVEQSDGLDLVYKVDQSGGGHMALGSDEVFHLRSGLSEDGFTGLSMVRQAAEAIDLARRTEQASNSLFENGVMVGGVLSFPHKLTPEVYERLRASLEGRRGAGNAHKEMILEEGATYTTVTSTAEQSQAIEQRQHQIEEISRAFGVPRPLLHVDDTSWGSGVDVLGQFFVRYGLNPWFEAWEQAIERSLLTGRDSDRYEAKFNAGGLLRGSMSDQVEFLTKGLGAGGHSPFLHPDEARDWLDLPTRDDLPAGMGATNGGPDEPA